MQWSTALPEWQERIRAGKSLVPCPPLFPAEAEAAMKIFRSLRLVDVAGKPRIGDVARAWVLEFAAAIFGAYDAETARRLINEFFLLISKKNGKSTIAAAIMLTVLLRNWRTEAEFLILAPTLEVANNSAGPAMAMVRHGDEEMRDLLKPVPHLRQIEHRTTEAKLKIVAADSETVGGKKATAVLVDELWLFGKKPSATNMLMEATGGLASRPEGFVLALSSQSDEPPTGVFKQWLKRYRDIRDGKLDDPKKLGVLFEFPPDMIEREEFKDLNNARITNPNLGASVFEDFLVERKATADQDGRHAQASFYAKHLNVEIGTGLRSDRWSGADYWQRQADPELSKLSAFDALESLLARCEVAVVGVDGGGLDDLFGLNVLGREPAEIEINAVVNGQEIVVRMKRWLSWSYAWCHEGVLERRKSIATKLLDLQEAGEMTIVDDELGDVGAAVDIIRQIKDRGLLGGVGVDPVVIGEFVDALAEPAIEVTQENKLLIGVSQGYAMMNAIKTAERRLANGTLRHCGGGLMAWCVGNIKIEPTATAIRATKQNAGDAKIDPAMALFDAVTVMSTNPEPVTGSFPDDYDLPVWG